MSSKRSSEIKGIQVSLKTVRLLFSIFHIYMELYIYIPFYMFLYGRLKKTQQTHKLES